MELNEFLEKIYSWSEKSYIHGFPQHVIFSREIIDLTKVIFEHCKLTNRTMDIRQSFYLLKNDPNCRLIIPNDIYNNIEKFYFTPTVFVMQICQRCYDEDIKAISEIEEYVRVTLPKLRLLCLEKAVIDHVKEYIPNAEIITFIDNHPLKYGKIFVKYCGYSFDIIFGSSMAVKDIASDLSSDFIIICKPYVKSVFDVDILNKIAKIIKERNFSAIRVIKDRNNDIKIEHNENLLLIDNRKTDVFKNNYMEMNQMTGNIGEWSELYTMFKLLADGKLYAADADTNKIPDIYYDVLKIIRGTDDNKLEYRRNGEVKVVNAETGETLCAVPISSFVEQTDKLLKGIKDKKSEKTKGAFELPESWNFAQSIKCDTLKAKSQDKADIILMVHDIMCGRDDTFGFSIKSQLGSPSTLFNASGATNFTYKVIGNNLSADEIAVFNGFSKFKDKFDYLHSLGADVIFIKADNETLDCNLRMVTYEMPKIFAEMMKCYFVGGPSKISELIDIIAENDVIHTLDNKVYLRHKVKELLTNIALGMVPAKLWTGDYEATGGYIIVKDDGDVVCYHIYNQNAFRNYMLANTRFDTPSKSKHGFGRIYEENGEQFLKLNVQIRFVK